MEVWKLIHAFFSRRPTTACGSSSSLSSSACLQPDLLSAYSDYLWFYSSVLPSSPPSLSCLSFLLPHVDQSTAIAQCMWSRLSPPPSCLSHPTLFCPCDLPDSHTHPPPRCDDDAEDGQSDGECGKNSYCENAHRRHAFMTDGEEDEDNYRNYPWPGKGEDDDAYYYFTAASDWDAEDDYHGHAASSDGDDEYAYHGHATPSSWDDEDAYYGHATPSDCEDEHQIDVTKDDAEQGKVLPAYRPKFRAHLEPDDALSGICDVDTVLNDQHDKRMQEVSDKSLTVPSSQFQGDVVARVSVRPLSRKEQADIKKKLKSWAHAVALTLPRPFL